MKKARAVALGLPSKIDPPKTNFCLFFILFSLFYFFLTAQRAVLISVHQLIYSKHFHIHILFYLFIYEAIAKGKSPRTDHSRHCPEEYTGLTEDSCRLLGLEVLIGNPKANNRNICRR